jgi:Transposase, Mutator family
MKKGKNSMTQPEASDTGLIPDPTLDAKAFKKVLMDRLRAHGRTQSVDTKQLFQSMVKETLQAFLELEMEEHLGYPKHDPEGRGSGNSRNGVTAKAVRGDSEKSRSRLRAIVTIASTQNN